VSVLTLKTEDLSYHWLEYDSFIP